MNMPLPEEQFKLFQELLNAIELQDIILHSMSYTRFPGTLSEGGALNIGFNTQQQISNNDPTKLMENITSFNPIYDIKMQINSKDAMHLRFHYGLAFVLKDAGIFDRALADEQVKQFFIQHQLPRITWSFLREEVTNAVRKAGFPPVTLPLMR